MNKVYLKRNAVDLDMNKLDTRMEYPVLFAMPTYLVLDAGYGKVINVHYRYIKCCLLYTSDAADE